MTAKVLYQISANDKLSIEDLKDLGVDGVYLTDVLTDKDEIMKQAQEAGLDIIEQKNLPINQDLTNMILNELRAPAKPKLDFLGKVNQLLKSEYASGLLNLGDDDKLLQMQALAMLALLADQLVVPANLIGEKDSQERRQIKKLINLKKSQTAGSSIIHITENDLIEIQKGKLTGYFNTSATALGFNSTSSWIQNYLVGQLLPKGVVIKED
ncbi:hypothetical protein [Lactobacillus sp. PV034]|uniref:hypothetical protein n=1 Tax=Lactobacillus sp. PV034 TaxID=2594495 RepID=UPI0022409AEA|nr:hypothetical protein [Lactobacillus sp. PV034]QNQ81232.1 hypothetical protein FP432_06540 [Lactobacillus sp. PV034]